MVRFIIVFIISTALSLSGCAKAVNAPHQTQNKAVLTPYEDPDGDGDDKGYNHFKMQGPATGHKVFVFDPNFDAWAAYNPDGIRVNTGKASGGSAYCPDIGRSCETIVGTFKVVSKGGFSCKSNAYPIETDGGAPMPYCMHFGSGGYAIHGSNSVPNYNASHGCIRVTPKAAKWLNKDFVSVGTTVIVLPYESESHSINDNFTN